MGQKCASNRENLSQTLTGTSRVVPQSFGNRTSIQRSREYSGLRDRHEGEYTAVCRQPRGFDCRRSTDDTKDLGQTLQQQPGDPRLKILAGQPRPRNQYGAGKNWVRAQAVQVATGDFLLFIDADVRPGSGAIKTAIATAETERIDLFTCTPALRKRVFFRVVSAADNVQSLSSLLRLYRRQRSLENRQCFCGWLVHVILCRGWH